MRLTTKQLGLESIAFQSTAFRDELAIVLSDLRKVPKKDLPDHADVRRLSNVVKHHSGLSVNFLIGDYDLSVRIPAVHKNNVLVNNFIRNYLSSADGLKMIQNSDKAASGTVNLITGKVTGVFADVTNEIMVPAQMVTMNKYTVEELAAGILHEIGHLLTYFEYMSEMASTNQCLAGLTRGLDGTGDVKERTVLLTAVKNQKGLSKLDAAELAKSNNNQVIELAVISNIVEQSRSQLDRSIYDLSSWEYLSDQYMARQGAARDGATLLAKIYKESWNISFRGSIGFLSMEALKLVLVFVAPVAAFVFMAMDSSGDGTYDVPGARLKRIRNQVVENLKDKKLDKDDIERLNADIAVIDDCLAQINDRRQFVGVLWDLLSPTARKDRSYTKLQQDLEALAANDLFTKAAQLRGM